MKTPTRKKAWLSRRHFAGAMTAGAVVPLLAQEQPQAVRRREPRPEVQPFDGAIEFSRRTKRRALRFMPFPMRQVGLTSGICKSAAEWIPRGFCQRLRRLPGDRGSRTAPARR